ncbi:MAG TPA: hypothetical protein VFU71_08340 [Burkholderiaceae bacterium]|nr:hypothetical protein [Burkholderiaceae bacterium]
MTMPRFGVMVPPHERPPVAWYQPDVLWSAARRVLSSTDLLRNRDLRESFELPLTVIDCSAPEADGDFWFDFIADTGDGGNATYAVASTVLADSVPDGAGADLPRGQLLLLGGDLAYPAASSEEYRYRFIEMYEAARRDFGGHDNRVRGRCYTLAALAQNHDWMDSAATFNRYFVRKNDMAPFLGARIPQRQTYFCAKLPRGWWALGFDFALTREIDRDQYEQFERLAGPEGLKVSVDGQTRVYRIEPNDRVILVYPEPYWTRPIGDGARPNWPKRYQRLEGLLRGRIALRLAGDLHHYVRWTSASDGMLVTCGTGGAFTHPTHTKTTTRPIVLRELRNEHTIPPPSGPAALGVGLDDRVEPADVKFERQPATVYPDVRESRSRAIGNLGALFKTNGSWRGGNWWFSVMLGALYWFNAYLNSLPFAETFRPDGFKPLGDYAPWEFWSTFVLWLKAMVFSPLGFVVNAMMIGACLAMGRETVDELPSKASRAWRIIVTWGFGLIHALVHVFAVYAVVFWIQLGVGHVRGIGDPGAGAWAAIGHATAVGATVFLYGAIVGAFIFGCYLALMSYLGFLTNNGYSALAIEDFKGFLRCRITADGALHAHFLAIDRVPRLWKRRAGSGGPVWVPDDQGDATPIATRVHDRFTL